ncbi:MAG: amino acid ABC transporter permease [Thermomicrobiales bacterium]|nr:amino acid ABC transporter permease [Thermomicrobiales bacterium]
MQVVWDNIGLLLIGLRSTLILSAVTVVSGSAVGLLGGVGLLFGPLPVRGLLRAYVDIVRGLPLLVLIFFIFYGLPAIGLDVRGFEAGALALSLFAGAHVSEIVRGGINAVPKGQIDAAKALGLTFWPRLAWVVFPQAAPSMLPPWINVVVEMVKGTSLVVLVSVNDLLFAATKVAERTANPMPLYLAAAALYFVVNFAISRSGAWLERRLSYG